MADMQMAKRPGTGSRGRRVLVVANAFKVNKLPDYNIMHYDLAITPEVPPRVNRQIYEQMRKNGMFGSVAAVYDGRKNIFAPAKLPFPNQSASGKIFLADSDRPPRPGQEPRGRTFDVTMRLVAEVNLHQLGQFINSRSDATSNVLMAITALNVMIRNDPSMLYPSKRASFYPPGREGDLPYQISGGLVMWGGYFTSIRATPGKLIVNLDRTAMAFIQSGDLVQVASKFMRVRDPADLARVMDRSRLVLERFLKGLQITTRSLEARDGKTTQKKKFKIRAVSRESAAQLTFENDQGQRTNIQAYFQQVYNYTLRFPTLPCVQVTKKAWYPMEICTVERGNKYTKKLNPDQVAEALKFTTQPPNRRLALIREGLGYLGLGTSDTLRSWQFGVETTPMQVKARVLDPPQLVYAGTGPQGQIMPRDGGWDIRGKKSTAAGVVERWVVIVFDSEQGQGRGNFGFPMPAAQNAVTQFARACQEFGMRFKTMTPVIFYAGDTLDVRGSFIEASKRSGFSPKEPPQLVCTFVAQKNSRQYPYIKQIGDVALGVATQNMVIQKVRNAKPSYFQNVALKVNVKLSGINQIIKGDLMPDFVKKGTIIFGADVGHPGPGSANPSIAALVASFDSQGVSYSTAVRAQTSREEMIVDLERMAIPLLKKYYKKNKRKPERIVFYRDGVSEGQYGEVCKKEVRALKKAFASIEPGYNPPITYVICGKRHHIRFFPSTQDGGDRSGNVRAGTVIDLDIVHPTDNDFYLMSHGGLLGTSRPCHYAVIVDENKMPPDEIQQLTYNLAYIYARSTRSVSIASPAYYAHHVATRARAHIGSEFDDDGATIASSASSGREEAQRDSRLAAAREKLRQVHINLEDTMFFM